LPRLLGGGKCGVPGPVLLLRSKDVDGRRFFTGTWVARDLRPFIKKNPSGFYVSENTKRKKPIRIYYRPLPPPFGFVLNY